MDPFTYRIATGRSLTYLRRARGAWRRKFWQALTVLISALGYTGAIYLIFMIFFAGG